MCMQFSFSVGPYEKDKEDVIACARSLLRISRSLNKSSNGICG
jgi:hypothetical protein